MKLIYTCSVFYMSLGLAMGVFYREYTKYLNFTGKTTLSTLHVHALVLGALFFILLMILERQVSLTAIKKFSLWLLLYNIALLGFLATLTIRGLLQVHGTDINGLNHIAGTFHTLFGFTWIWFLLMLKKAFKV